MPVRIMLIFPFSREQFHRSLKRCRRMVGVDLCSGGWEYSRYRQGVIDGRGKGRKGRVGGVPGDADGGHEYPFYFIKGGTYLRYQYEEFQPCGINIIWMIVKMLL